MNMLPSSASTQGVPHPCSYQAVVRAPPALYESAAVGTTPVAYATPWPLTVVMCASSTGMTLTPPPAQCHRVGRVETVRKPDRDTSTSVRSAPGKARSSYARPPVFPSLSPQDLLLAIPAIAKKYFDKIFVLAVTVGASCPYQGRGQRPLNTIHRKNAL